MSTKRITLRTKIGFGYTAITGETVTKPMYFGTIRTLETKINRDRTFKSLLSGGTYITGQFFLYNSDFRRWEPISRIEIIEASLELN